MDIEEILSRGKKSRFFRSTKKLTSAHLVSHITQRAAGREPLFIEDHDYHFMLGLLKETAERAPLALYAFCLMPNHVHLLIGTQKDNLSDKMRDLFSKYARFFNRKYERKGHLFGGPYRQSVCFQEKYLMAASLYIHLNPLRAGLVPHPSRYRWSSLRLYSEPKAPRSFVDSSFILGLISEDIKTAKQSYRQLLNQAAGQEMGEVLEEESTINRLLAQLKSLSPKLWEGISAGRLNNQTGTDLLDEGELARLIERLKKKGSMQKADNRQARKFLIEQLIARGFTRNEIANRLGLSVKTIYNCLN